MSNILNSEDFGLKIYNRFPPKYREDDVLQNYTLKRYLQALSDGGFKYAIDDINGITDLKSPDKVNSKVLEILFKQYGLDIFKGIPEEYLRYLLPKLGEAWSKKGSLDVIEFVTSSITGVKTSSDVTYVEQTPVITVKFEMDYGTDDYFPDSAQFSKLLENFIPFYCDLVLLYSYLFYEQQVLMVNEPYDRTLITDTKMENSNLVTSDLDLYKRITSVYSEPTPLKVNEFKSDLVRLLTPISESGVLQKSGDSYTESYAYMYNENAGILLRKYLENPETDSLLGEAIMGSSILGVTNEEYDSILDNITETRVDSTELTFISKGALTNDIGFTTNNTFITNSIYCYDKIYKSGKLVETLFYI